MKSKKYGDKFIVRIDKGNDHWLLLDFTLNYQC